MTFPIRKDAVRRAPGAIEDLPAVFHATPTKAALHQTIHQSNKSVSQLAFECGRISPNYLYRACLTGESGCRFPLDLAVPLMRATGDYRLLDVVAGECDRAVVSMPRVKRMKAADAQVVNEVAANFNGVMAATLKYFAAPDREQIPEVIQALRRHLAEVVSLARAVADFHQGELL